MQKTVTVAVDRLVQHKLYKKTLRRTSKFLAHDESGSCGVGDRVRIVESRPLSRHKRWVVEAILRRGIEAGEPELEEAIVEVEA
jgi:small subunit ribosomal protein S17